MSEDLVNQLTLSYMISKKQLEKLNKRIKNDNDTIRRTDKEIYKDRVIQLFHELLNNEDNLVTEDVKFAFTCFMDKSIYYFKQCDKCEDLEKERSNRDSYLDETTDFDADNKSELVYECKSNDSIDTQEDTDTITDFDIAEEKNIKNKKIPELKEELEETQNIVKRSHITKKTPIKSKGVENIDDIQVNWFQNVQQQYKSNKIIPRKKDIIIAGHHHNK